MIPLRGFPDYYITSDGIFYSSKGKSLREMKISKTSNGYRFISLRKNGRYYQLLVHRLLCEHFKKEWDPLLDVNHLNGIKSDNRLDNLEMCTRSENMQHAMATGLFLNRGSDNGAAIFDMDTVRQIRSLKGVISQVRIAEMFSCCKGTIARIHQNKRYK